MTDSVFFFYDWESLKSRSNVETPGKLILSLSPAKKKKKKKSYFFKKILFLLLNFKYLMLSYKILLRSSIVYR